MIEFIACPFCHQSFAALDCEGADHFVVCGACDARGPRKATAEEAANAWNIRAADANSIQPAGNGSQSDTN